MALVVLFLPRGIIPTRRGTRSRRGASAARPALVGARLELRERRERAAAQPAPSRPRRCSRSGAWRSASAALRAVDGASFAVPEGSITALIGPNGSGKTTVFNLIGGTMRADAGEVWFDGERIDGLRPWRRAYRGHRAHVPDHAAVPRDDRAGERRRAAARVPLAASSTPTRVSGPEAERAEELLDFVGMKRVPRPAQAGALSYGQQKLVELAQILMLDPKLILLDEPAGGINPTLIERMGEMIRELNAQGKTFLIVEHNMPFVLGLCDPVLVLARGQTIARARPAQIQRDPKRARRLPGRRLRARGAGGGDVPDAAPADGVIAGYGGGDVLQGVDLEVAHGLDRLHRRPQRRRQVDGAAGGQRAAAPARGRGHARRRRDSHGCSPAQILAAGVVAGPAVATRCSRTSPCARTC